MVSLIGILSGLVVLIEAIYLMYIYLTKYNFKH